MLDFVARSRVFRIDPLGLSEIPNKDDSIPILLYIILMYIKKIFWLPPLFLLPALIFFTCDETPYFSDNSQSVRDRPNFLFIISDDQSWIHTSKTGYELVSTPNFDRIATEGLFFKNSFASAPSCTPSRSAILSGQDFWRLESAAFLWGTYSNNMISYQDILKSAGYAVGYTGKGWGPGTIIIPGGEPTGEEYNKIRRPPTENLEPFDLAANFAEFLRDKPAGKPFSFWIGSFEPHRNFDENAPNRFTDERKSALIPPFLPPINVVKNQLSGYLSEIEYFDNDLGQIIQLLKDHNLFENTIIVVTSDNGFEFSRGKPTIYEFGVRVPLAIYWSKITSPSRTIEDFVSLIDIAPTFLEAAGIETPEAMTGKSLLNILTSSTNGQVEPERDAAFVGYERHALYIREGNATYSSRAIYTKRFTYIINRFPDRWPAGDPPKYVEAIPWLIKDPVTHEFLEPYFSLVAAKRPLEELYDLQKDPYQLNNVANDPDYADILAVLSHRLKAKLEQTNDPVEASGEDVFSHYEYFGPKE
ncbi:MAG: sulfatase family protein [Methylococcales bacterium]